MKTKIQLKKRHTIPELKDAAKDSRDEEQKTRIKAVIALKKDVSRSVIAKEFLIDPKTLRYWICSYNKNGLEGLVMSKGGRPEGNPVWDTSIFTALTKELDKQERCWSIPLMQDWIKKHKKKLIPESTILYHLNVLKYSYKSLRPHPYLGDKRVQDTFKKRV